MIVYIGKRVRKEKNISNRELSRMSGVSSGSISKWENGIHLPDLASLEQIAMALDVGPWDLIFFKPDKKDDQSAIA